MFKDLFTKETLIAIAITAVGVVVGLWLNGQVQTLVAKAKSSSNS